MAVVGHSWGWGGELLLLLLRAWYSYGRGGVVLSSVVCGGGKLVRNVVVRCRPSSLSKQSPSPTDSAQRVEGVRDLSFTPERGFSFSLRGVFVCFYSESWLEACSFGFGLGRETVRGRGIKVEGSLEFLRYRNGWCV